MDCDATEFIDLHIHSNASDGTLSPNEIIETAQYLGIRAISITDHDTVEGNKIALSHGVGQSLRFLTGVEISARKLPAIPGGGSLHILGYGMDVYDATFNEALKRFQSARKNRNPQIIDRLNALGIDISLEEICEKHSTNTQVGRPHIANALVSKGITNSIDEAFDRLLGAGQPAYVEKERMPSEDVIQLISNAGGISVLAHPGLLSIQNRIDLIDILKSLVDMGIDGIEAIYPEHSPDETAFFIDIANRFELLVTGGTDFHGAIKPEVQIGKGAGNGFQVPFEIFETLLLHLDSN